MNARYTRTAIALHWLIAVGIGATFVLGLYMHDLPLSPTKLKLYSWHKWAGVTLFALAAFRLGWRLTHPAPALPDTMPPRLRQAAHVAHGLLYALMFAIPIVGWLMSSAKGFQTVWFGVLPLPDLLDKNKALGDALAEVHETLAFILLGLVVVHAAAALKHHFIDRDTVLSRMLPHRS
ncbi:cytochrome b [Nitrogeniibacter mangrovi]|uniref:Cytochrome b n=1 Tax=Nitrogeniibacter mangrovi TaxID=2016596 RepID=A0A6C1B3L9_9RHOO|nr:cytochrome b [Nitrogeniibacter mangrovi]QID17983.1 cytochrome b [Nitrogeniibacter mangrovi]